MLGQTATSTGFQGTKECACYQGRKSNVSFALVEHAYQQGILCWSAGNDNPINDEQVMGIAVLHHMPEDARSFYKAYIIHR